MYIPFSQPKLFSTSKRPVHLELSFQAGSDVFSTSLEIRPADMNSSWGRDVRLVCLFWLQAVPICNQALAAPPRPENINRYLPTKRWWVSTPASPNLYDPRTWDSSFLGPPVILRALASRNTKYFIMALSSCRRGLSAVIFTNKPLGLDPDLPMSRI